eukprot:CAMPEP_0114247254 /NCGR_PEP_ID=MMETSP0058-20121206/12922_1 /TAXON_ID=36894 /ORGANISM="Pyramimonas parkeae, CCMP726" /LENGTH=507 /DNA_ID=CAMNT_0001360543 /DNA_START=58 /DNA_END=1581 /DNA_ORIENTATION=-
MAAVGIGASLYVINRTNEKRNQPNTLSGGSRARCVRVRAVSAPERPPAAAKGEWTPGSWRAREAKQQPTWPDQNVLKNTLEEIERYPPLVFAGEARNLQEKLAQVASGDGFVLQCGDCAESFAEFRADNIRDTFRVILQMSAVLMYGSGVPVVKIGRMAGQFAKPRSADMEEKDGVELPSYRGDNINSDEFTLEARVPNPSRLIRAYNQSAATLNLLRGFAMGGYASLERVSNWNLDFMSDTEQGVAYKKLAEQLDEAMLFMRACGIDEEHPIMTSTDFFTSHEALLLEYEQSLTRLDSTTNKWYGCSAHLLWIGERTRQLDCAHIEFMRGINNPIGIKISDKCDGAELIELIETINPNNTPGKIMIIVRMGADKLRENLPRLIKAVQDSGKIVVWQSDPMHGNTIKSDNGYKTRPFERIRDELRAFFDVHEQMGTHAGGVHLEMTGQDVTECTGGTAVVEESDLPLRYHTHCDPRLNASQALELAFLISQRLRKQRVAEAAARQSS